MNMVDQASSLRWLSCLSGKFLTLHRKVKHFVSPYACSWSCPRIYIRKWKREKKTSSWPLQWAVCTLKHECWLSFSACITTNSGCNYPAPVFLMRWPPAVANSFFWLRAVWNIFLLVVLNKTCTWMFQHLAIDAPVTSKVAFHHLIFNE